MYVLLYVDQDSQPGFVQGSLDEINERLRTLWMNGDIGQDEWELSGKWELLGIKDGRLTPIRNCNFLYIPHFEVS